MSSGSTKCNLLSGFDDPLIPSELWNNLLRIGSSDVIFMTWQWQKTWWEVFGRGQLLLVLVEDDGKPIAIAPLFADSGMIYFVGSGSSDYLDFIGNLGDAITVDCILHFTKRLVPDFKGFCFYHVLEKSETVNILSEINLSNKWQFHDEGCMPAPLLSIKAFPEQAQRATRKKSLLRHENWFKKNGELRIEHLSSKGEVLPHLDTFFNQHINRWSATSFPSLFLDKKQQLFYQSLVNIVSDCGWLRFTIVWWRDTPVSYHFGFNYKGSFIWYKPTFDISLSQFSPGEVLIRQLLLKAIEEDAEIFDFGLGDEDFKKRFATNVRTVKNCGMYLFDNKQLPIN